MTWKSKLVEMQDAESGLTRRVLPNFIPFYFPCFWVPCVVVKRCLFPVLLPSFLDFSTSAQVFRSPPNLSGPNSNFLVTFGAWRKRAVATQSVSHFVALLMALLIVFFLAFFFASQIPQLGL
jgi:hypothetical protein